MIQMLKAVPKPFAWASSFTNPSCLEELNSPSGELIRVSNADRQYLNEPFRAGRIVSVLEWATLLVVLVMRFLLMVDLAGLSSLETSVGLVAVTRTAVFHGTLRSQTIGFFYTTYLRLVLRYCCGGEPRLNTHTGVA